MGNWYPLFLFSLAPPPPPLLLIEMVMGALLFYTRSKGDRFFFYVPFFFSLLLVFLSFSLPILSLLHRHYLLLLPSSLEQDFVFEDSLYGDNSRSFNIRLIVYTNLTKRLYGLWIFTL